MTQVKIVFATQVNDKETFQVVELLFERIGLIVVVADMVAVGFAVQRLGGRSDGREPLGCGPFRCGVSNSFFNSSKNCFISSRLLLSLSLWLMSELKCRSMLGIWNCW